MLNVGASLAQGKIGGSAALVLGGGDFSIRGNISGKPGSGIDGLAATLGAAFRF